MDIHCCSSSSVNVTGCDSTACINLPGEITAGCQCSDFIIRSSNFFFFNEILSISNSKISIFVFISAFPVYFPNIFSFLYLATF